MARPKGTKYIETCQFLDYDIKKGSYILFKTDKNKKGNPNKKKFPNGYVYFIRMHNSNYYKIGVSNNPKRRLRDIDSYLPNDFDILSLHYFEGVYNVEEELKELLKKHNTKREWYILSVELAQQVMIHLHNKSLNIEKHGKR